MPGRFEFCGLKGALQSCSAHRLPCAFGAVPDVRGMIGVSSYNRWKMNYSENGGQRMIACWSAEAIFIPLDDAPRHCD
jgi:hypothetical protein